MLLPALSATEFLKESILKIRQGQFQVSETSDLLDRLEELLASLQQAQESDIYNVLECIYDAIQITDGEGNIIYVNKAFLKSTGFNKDELLGKNVTDLLNSGIYKGATTPDVIKNKKQVNLITEHKRTGVKALVTGIPLFDDLGNVKKVVVLNRNIDDLNQMQTELHKTKEKMKIVEDSNKRNERELDLLRKMQLPSTDFITKSPEMQNIEKMINQVAPFNTTVLIMGESGTGKEVLANEIHSRSDRKNTTFIKVNCAAIPANLLESELFGYEKGSFTGANFAKMGIFEISNKGTLLLDEIGDMPMELQPKLLRAIQQQEITRIGASKPIKLDVRIIASTNRDLKELVNAGKFREDLYYRLSVFPIYVLPLRNRLKDLEPLVHSFMTKYNHKYNKAASISYEGIEIMEQYSWPGNIRELNNIIERLLIVSEHDAVIEAQHISDILGLDSYYLELSGKNHSLKELLDAVERKTLEKVLAKSKNTREAAQKLAISQSAVVKKAKKFNISLR